MAPSKVAADHSVTARLDGIKLRRYAISDLMESSPAETPFRNPTTGVVGCCPRAASGHAAAAPLRSVMNSRRGIIR
jgi:hypothetical protein